MAAEEAPGDGDALPLASGQVYDVEFPGEHGIITLWKRAGLRPRHGAYAVQPGFSGFCPGIADDDVLGQGHLVALVFLEYRGGPACEGVHGKLPGVNAVFPYRALPGQVESGYQADQGGLSGAVLAHHRQGLPLA